MDIRKRRFSKRMTSNVDRKNDLKTLRVDAEFFENGRKKKAPFSKIFGYVLMGT